MKFKAIFLQIIFLTGASNLVGQGNNFFDSMYSKTVSSIDWRNINSDDLGFFDTIIDSRDLLILSEGSHKEGGSFDAQCSILKYLIEGGLIKTVFIEWDWLTVERINNTLKKFGRDSISEVQKYMNSFGLLYWSKNEFWDYLANQIMSNRIRLVGIDIGISNVIMHELLDEFSVKDSVSFNSFEFNDVITDLLQISSSYYKLNYSVELYNQSKSFINKAIEYYISENNTDRVRQWKMVTSYLYWRFYRQFDKNGERLKDPFENRIAESLFHSIRDSIMTEIFTENWQHGSGKSVLLISAYHAMKNPGCINDIEHTIKDSNVKTFGEILNDKNILKIYSICFITASGNRGAKFLGEKKLYKVAKPHKFSIENYLSSKPSPFIFLDFSDFQQYDFYMNPFTVKPLKAKWGNVFSGVFFIKNMYPL